MTQTPLSSERISGQKSPVSKTSETSRQNDSAEVTAVQVSTRLPELINQILGAEKKNRLESILSETIIFAMNSGQWRHASKAQLAYEQITGPDALGPLISSSYIAMGYGQLSEAIERLQDMESKIGDEQIWGLRAFLGLFMIFDGKREEAFKKLTAVAQVGDLASQQMAQQLLSEFFKDAPRPIPQAQSKPVRTSRVNVPGVPLN